MEPLFWRFFGVGGCENCGYSLLPLKIYHSLDSVTLDTLLLNERAIFERWNLKSEMLITFQVQKKLYYILNHQFDYQFDH